MQMLMKVTGGSPTKSIKNQVFKYFLAMSFRFKTRNPL